MRESLKHRAPLPCECFILKCAFLETHRRLSNNSSRIYLTTKRNSHAIVSLIHTPLLGGVRSPPSNMQRIDQTACAAASVSAPSHQLTQAFLFLCRGGATRTTRDTQRFWMSPGPFLKAKFVHDSLHVFLR